MKVEVFNVGQGDSMLLFPDYYCWKESEGINSACCMADECEGEHYGYECCEFEHVPLLIDCGPKSANVVNRLPLSTHQVLLTHSHQDHVGGFPDIYKKSNIEQLILPYYLPEVMNIAKFLGKKIPSIYGNLNWGIVNRIRNVRLVGDGDHLGHHISIFNPPKYPADYFQLDHEEAPTIESSLLILREYGFELPENQIIDYNSPINDQTEEYLNLARTFVHLFFRSLSMQLTKNGILSAASYIAAAHIEMTANQASIVFKYEHHNGDWLFTGDADQSVFNRLINKNDDITAKYLKIPHHGSRENMSSSILAKIAPEVAIISHANRAFGRSNDPHPHHEVIDLLDTNGIRSYYTNTVIKNKAIIKLATVNSVENGSLLFR